MFWRLQKWCSILQSLNSTSSPDRAGSFQRLLEVLKPTQFPPTTIKVLCHPSRTPDFSFITQILGGNMTSRNQGLSPYDKGESLETRGCHILNLAISANLQQRPLKLGRLIVLQKTHLYTTLSLLSKLIAIFQRFLALKKVIKQFHELDPTYLCACWILQISGQKIL